MLFDTMHHAAIIVSDYQRSKAFYTETLGFPILRENFRADRGDWKLDLQFGDGELEIFAIPGAPPRPSYPEAQGLRHLAFRVDDVEAAVRELEARGVPCEPIRRDPYTGGRMTFFHDPDGLPLELHE
jgi:glyoxylase I family protein